MRPFYVRSASRATARFATGLALFLTLTTATATAITVDFEDVGGNLPISGNPYYNGESAYDPGDADATDWVGGGIATFNNEFTPLPSVPGCCWQGWAYSQDDDTVTGGSGNQYSAVTGIGAGGSDTYAVGYTGAGQNVDDVSTLVFSSELTVLSAEITNTTYAWDSMLNGDGFAKQFGGLSGDDPDFFLLTITGYDALGIATGSVDFYLADYRDANNANDYIVTDWTTVDLSGLGAVKSLGFGLDSSDNGFGFLNNPAYFALDDLVVVPEPGSGLLLGLGLAFLARRRR